MDKFLGGSGEWPVLSPARWHWQCRLPRASLVAGFGISFLASWTQNLFL